MNAMMNLELAIFTTAVGLKSPMYEIVHRKFQEKAVCYVRSYTLPQLFLPGFWLWAKAGTSLPPFHVLLSTPFKFGAFSFQRYPKFVHLIGNAIQYGDRFLAFCGCVIDKNYQPRSLTDPHESI